MLYLNTLSKSTSTIDESSAAGLAIMLSVEVKPDALTILLWVDCIGRLNLILDTGHG